MSIPAFPKVFTLGDKNTAFMFEGPVEVTEKIDGSQFSFGKVNGEILIRSKGKVIYKEAPDKMFSLGVEYVLSIEDALPEGLIFHGEYLRAPDHNSLTYGRIPKNHFMLFGIRDFNNNEFVSKWEDLARFADKLDVEVIPKVYSGTMKAEDAQEAIDEWLNTDSVLGNAKIEGVVFKNYTQQALIGGLVIPILCGKYVSEAFKEKHGVVWSAKHPRNIDKLGAAFCTEARWHKAIQYLRDNGELKEAVQDIGPLIHRINQDIEEEDLDNIKEELWKIFRSEVLRTATRGFPQWYKNHLVEGLKKNDD